MGSASKPATPAAKAGSAAAEAVPYPSTYKPLPSQPTLIRNATVLTATGPRIEGGSVLMRDGKIVAVGAAVEAPADALVVDGTGKWVTPGLIDTHSHLGVYAAPGGDSLSDGNEATSPNTAEVWAEHSVWPQDPQFPLALAGGVTTMEILPGSANLFGGRSVTLKNVPSVTVQGMKFPGAPYGLKMACGENPKRVYGGKGRSPSTRMGNFAGYREAWIKARAYEDKLKKWRDEGSDPAKRPDRDLQMETLAGVLEGKILVQNHCYRADEMAQVIDMSKEFGYKVASFHHAVEAYKIRDLLAKEGICGSLWSNWWGFKIEAYDGIPQNIALMNEAGACAIVHSDSAQGIQRLNQDAAKAMRAGHEAGIKATYEDAIRWITINPAHAIGVEQSTGSLEAGKMADVVLWSGDPFSIYSKPEKVYIDGALLFDRNDPKRRPTTDFELGLPTEEVPW
ncbi:MAG TPA: amidohydrolase [Thermoanaerobaculia bacterium]|jgi:imidazolonepropionase-like amidohydrolase|nr:amidohydrolase [Thermoanaerobaculia bacterium]